MVLRIKKTNLICTEMLRTFVLLIQHEVIQLMTAIGKIKKTIIQKKQTVRNI